MKKILVVDDSPMNLQLMRDLLKDKYSLVLVKSGNTALDYLKNKTVDLILVDLIMPEIDGIDTVKEIRKITGDEKRIPAILISSTIEEADRLRGINAGIDYFLERPVKPEVLYELLENAERKQ